MKTVLEIKIQIKPEINKCKLTTLAVIITPRKYNGVVAKAQPRTAMPKFSNNFLFTSKLILANNVKQRCRYGSVLFKFALMPNARTLSP